MGVRNASSGNNTIVNAVITGAAVIIGAQTGLIGLVQDNAQVIISWYVVLLIGTAITGLNVGIRRGALITSPLITVNQGISVTAGLQMQFGGTYVDTPGVLGQVQYTLTLNPTGAANNSTLLDVSLVAFVL